MYGQPNNLQEKITDDWINQNIPGGVNSEFLSSSQDKTYIITCLYVLRPSR